MKFSLDPDEGGGKERKEGEGVDTEEEKAIENSPTS